MWNNESPDDIKTRVYLVHTNVALVTEHHVVPLLAVGGAAHVADHVLVVLDPQAFHRLDGVVHVVMALPLQGLHGALHCQLVYGFLPWKTNPTRSEKPRQTAGTWQVQIPMLLFWSWRGR